MKWRSQDLVFRDEMRIEHLDDTFFDQDSIDMWRRTFKEPGHIWLIVIDQPNLVVMVTESAHASWMRICIANRID